MLVDGGSRDGTIEIARRVPDVTALVSPRGRADSTRVKSFRPGSNAIIDSTTVVMTGTARSATMPTSSAVIA